MKKFNVRITMVVGMSEDPLYHEYTLEAESEMAVFRKITSKDWYMGKREVRFYNKPEHNKTYYEFIKTKYIADICIDEVKIAEGKEKK